MASVPASSEQGQVFATVQGLTVVIGTGERSLREFVAAPGGYPQARGKWLASLKLGLSSGGIAKGARRWRRLRKIRMKARPARRVRLPRAPGSG